MRKLKIITEIEATDEWYDDLWEGYKETHTQEVINLNRIIKNQKDKTRLSVYFTEGGKTDG